MENFPWHDLLADTGVVIAIVVSFWGIWRKVRETRDGTITRLVTLETKLTGIENRLNDCHIELTNHIPTQIRALSDRVNNLSSSLVAHEARENVYWKLVEKHISGE